MNLNNAKIGLISLLISFSCFFALGCDDGGGYELQPCTTCGTPDGGAGAGGDDGNLNPGGSAGGGQSPQPGCKSVPAFWDMRSYNGCMTTSDLSGAFRMADRKEYSYVGKPFVDNASQKQGEVWYMTADGNECGPMTISAVSNSGTVQLVAAVDVDWYLVEPAMAEVIWTQLHNGQAPGYNDIQSAAFGSLLLDIFECEVTNVTCALKASIPGGWPTYGGMVKFQHTGPNAKSEGAFCGHMYVVARSR
jgi:hypothetical protein